MEMRPRRGAYRLPIGAYWAVVHADDGDWLSEERRTTAIARWMSRELGVEELYDEQPKPLSQLMAHHHRQGRPKPKAT